MDFQFKKSALGLLAAWLTLAAPALPALADHATANRMLQRGLALEKEKQYNQAATMYEAALIADPDLAPALRHLGDCNYYLKNKAKAVEAYNRYLKIYPDKSLEAFVQKISGPPAGSGPAPTPVPTVNTAKVFFYKQPLWERNDPEQRELASGKFGYPMFFIMSQAWSMLADEGMRPYPRDIVQRRIYSDAVLINSGFIKGKDNNPGDDSGYSLVCQFVEVQRVTQIVWQVHQIHEVGQSSRGGSSIGLGFGLGGGLSVGFSSPIGGMAPPSASEIAAMNSKELETSTKLLREKGLPPNPVGLNKEVYQKIQEDWNYRLWKYLLKHINSDPNAPVPHAL